MKAPYSLLAITLLLLSPFHTVKSATVYSVDSLQVLCSGNKEDNELCGLYIHGVVETWMLNDLESFEPTRYRSRVGQPTFCETIIRVSEEEWVRIIRESLPTMRPGLASVEVQKALAKNLCEP